MTHSKIVKIVDSVSVVVAQSIDFLYDINEIGTQRDIGDLFIPSTIYTIGSSAFNFDSFFSHLIIFYCISIDSTVNTIEEMKK